MIYILSVLFSFSLWATSEIKCEASYDELGITRQHVNSLDEYYYCFGYHHGRDRAWAMDYFRRVAQGRNAELYGFSSLKGDLMMRLLDLPKLASRLYHGLPEKHKKWLGLYAEGANQGFVEGKNAHEFLDLNYSPEEWRPEHSIMVLMLQSFDQTRKTFFRDYEEEKIKEKWKDKTADLFNEDDAPWLNTILKEGEYEKTSLTTRSTTQVNSKSLTPRLWDNFPEVFGKESGSNNWVISKAKSKNGFAILANDPHLDLKTPLFWYWLNLKTSDINIIGATVPGVPFIPSGTNGKVAWGLTNAYINTADAVYLKDIPKEKIISIRPTVKVKFGPFQLPFFFKSFEKTIDDDIILPFEVEHKAKLALKWSGFHIGPEHILPMFDLIHTKSVDDINDTLKQVGVPAWNFVFADTKGDIGYRVVGQAYRHQFKNPYGISEASWESFKDSDFLDPMERPNLLRPKRNYIYSANNRHWPEDSKFYGGRGYSYSFRGFRIDELLKQGKHDVESFQQIQCDRQVVDARFFVPKLLKLLDIPELKGWNFIAQDDSVATSVYRRLMDLIMDGWHVNEYALFKLLDNLTDAQKNELTSFYQLAKKQIAKRNWGSLHRLTFAHLSKNSDWKFSPEISGIGDNHSVDPGTSKWDADKEIYEQYSGASMRMIVVMKEKPEIYLALPGYNRNYSQKQLDVPAWNEWRTCEYRNVKW